LEAIRLSASYVAQTYTREVSQGASVASKEQERAHRVGQSLAIGDPRRNHYSDRRTYHLSALPTGMQDLEQGYIRLQRHSADAWLPVKAKVEDHSNQPIHKNHEQIFL
jgi:hypothetical protein